MKHALFTIVALCAFSCSTLAQYAESEVPAVFEPNPGAILEQDFASIAYSYCVEGVCVERLSELTRFDLTLDDGSTVACLAIRQLVTWPDGSSNDWIWPAKESHDRCQAEMERMSEED